MEKQEIIQNIEKFIADNETKMNVIGNIDKKISMSGAYSYANQELKTVLEMLTEWN